MINNAVVLIVNILLRNTKISRTKSPSLTTTKKLTINRSMSLPKHSMMMNLEKKLLVLVQLQTFIVSFSVVVKPKLIVLEIFVFRSTMFTISTTDIFQVVQRGCYQHDRFINIDLCGSNSRF